MPIAQWFSTAHAHTSDWGVKVISIEYKRLNLQALYKAAD